MKKITKSVFRRFLTDQSGQTMLLVGLGLTALLGVGGLTVDVGNAYVTRAQLQSATNSAALAAADGVYDTGSSSAATVAKSYVDSNFKAFSANAPTVTMECLNFLMPGNKGCSSISSTPSNAVKVQMVASVKTYFMEIFGVKTLNVGATATAAMEGTAQPWNVAIILDGTNSMTSNKDSNCGGVTRFQCALTGVKALLQTTNPCAPGASSCTSACTAPATSCASTANFRVSLFSFPNVTTATAADDYGSGTPTAETYTFPLNTATSYTSLKYGSTTSTYQVVGWDSGYYDPSTTSGLSATDDLAKAINGDMKAPGGESTYYASVIYAAQAALDTEQTANPGSQNAIILLSDGEANAAAAKFTTGAPTPSTSGATFIASPTKTTGYYPSATDECQQAIMAAQVAAKAGTRVYGVAYGSESAGCYGSGDTDSSLIITNQTGLNAGFTLSQLTPCITIENIASSLDYFYSDANQSGTGVDTSCQDASHTVTSLSDIFLAIGSTFTNPRLVPNSAT